MPLENTMSGTNALSFAHGDQIFGKLAARQTARLIANASDLTLITDFHGTIKDIAFQSDGLHSAVGRHWVGKKFVEVVTSECVDKAEEILGAARDDREVLPREINHLTKHGDNLPVRYSAARLRYSAPCLRYSGSADAGSLYGLQAVGNACSETVNPCSGNGYSCSGTGNSCPETGNSCSETGNPC